MYAKDMRMVRSRMWKIITEPERCPSKTSSLKDVEVSGLYTINANLG